MTIFKTWQIIKREEEASEAFSRLMQEINNADLTAFYRNYEIAMKNNAKSYHYYIKEMQLIEDDLNIEKSRLLEYKGTEDYEDCLELYKESSIILKQKYDKLKSLGIKSLQVLEFDDMKNNLKYFQKNLF